MATSNVPFTYAVDVNGTIHLYLLIYSDSDPAKVIIPANGTVSGQKFLVNVTLNGSGSTKYYKLYTFSKTGIDTVRVTAGGHIREIELADFDNSSSAPTDPNNNQRAVEAPYSYTQKKGNDNDRFTAEVVLFSSTAQRFTCAHSGPVGAATDTTSTISVSADPNVPTTAEFNDKKDSFLVPNWVNTGGAHEVVYTTGPKRAKVKNKNHSQT